MNSLLSLVTFLPLIGAVVLLVFLRGDDDASRKNAKLLALFTTSATFLLSLFVLAGFDPSDTGFQFVEESAWLGGLTYKMGVDGISVLFVLLTTVLMPVVILSCWDVTDRIKEYMIAFLMLESLMLGVFCALDMVLFYLFFEAGLIPMFLIIGIWGGKRRIYASFKFFLYTLAGSLLMLVALLYLFMESGGSFSILEWHKLKLGMWDQTWIFWFFLASFAVSLSRFARNPFTPSMMRWPEL